MGRFPSERRDGPSSFFLSKTFDWDVNEICCYAFRHGRNVRMCVYIFLKNSDDKILYVSNGSSQNINTTSSKVVLYNTYNLFALFCTSAQQTRAVDIYSTQCIYNIKRGSTDVGIPPWRTTITNIYPAKSDGIIAISCRARIIKIKTLFEQILKNQI